MRCDKFSSVQCNDSMQSYIDCSGCTKSSLVDYCVSQFKRIFSVTVKVAVVDVDGLNDGKTISSWNTIA